MTWQHGKQSSYNKYRCRCDECRAANTRQIQRQRRERAERLRADPSLCEHGLSDTYDNWGCRCEACTLAARIKNMRYKLRLLAAELGANPVAPGRTGRLVSTG